MLGKRKPACIVFLKLLSSGHTLTLWRGSEGGLGLIQQLQSHIELSVPQVPVSCRLQAGTTEQKVPVPGEKSYPS